MSFIEATRILPADEIFDINDEFFLEVDLVNPSLLQSLDVFFGVDGIDHESLEKYRVGANFKKVQKVVLIK